MTSFYQYLKLPSAIDEISENYASIPPATSLSSARIVCQASIDKFNQAYSDIDFRVLGRLQSFRNNFIAHISWSEVGKLLKYNELEALVEIVCRLAGELSLFTSGKNDWPKENKTQIFEETVEYWTAIFSADAADLLNYGPKDMMDIPAQH